MLGPQRTLLGSILCIQLWSVVLAKLLSCTVSTDLRDGGGWVGKVIYSRLNDSETKIAQLLWLGYLHLMHSL